MKEIIVVGDIGSTKSSWWVNSKDPEEIRLGGYNPIAQHEEIGAKMLSSLAQALHGITPDCIWYYGAGIVDNQVSTKVSKLLLSHFPASKSVVNSDLEGAAIATCGQSQGTVAILGTGSHAAVFDGKKILRKAQALGYILGDEGGGCDIGKTLLRSYFYEEMPDVIREEMRRYLPHGRTGLVSQLYASPAPNQFLAAFAQLAVDMKDEAWIKELVTSRFKLFLKNILLPLNPIQPVHILGSIGCIFADLFENELSKHAIQAGTFLKDPSYRLFTMHLNHEIEE